MALRIGVGCEITVKESGAMSKENEHVSITWENMEHYSHVPIEYRFVDSADVIPGKEG